MNPCSITYLPRPGVGYTDAFLENLRRFPAKHPILFYTHSAEIGPEFKSVIRLPADIESRLTPDDKGKTSRVALTNLIFFTGLSIAASSGFSHILVLETDCRVGCKHWDDWLFKEFIHKNDEAVFAGTPMCFNPSAWNRTYAERYEKMLRDTPNRPIPISVTGSGRLGERFEPCLFPNGALAIYRVDWLLRLFPEVVARKTVELSHRIKTWDMEIGKRAWKEFEEKVWDKFVVLEREYSGYLDVISSEGDRRELLESEKVVAVHQIKSDWKGPEVKAEPINPSPISQLFRNVPPELDMLSLARESHQRVVEMAANHGVWEHQQERTLLIEGDKSTTIPSVEILIVTFHKDFEFLRYALKSIRKFAAGFAGTTVIVPKHEKRYFARLCKEHDAELIGVDEQPETGFLNHMCCKCEADLHCEAEYIMHMDADCFFAAPATPLDYFKDGKPILLCRPYVSVMDDGHRAWRHRAEHALGFKVTHDFMVRHPTMFNRRMYPAMRAHIQELHKQEFRPWVLSGQNAFPQSFAEFPTMGAFAYEKQREDYSVIDLGDEAEPKNHVLQGWSRQGINHVLEWKDKRKASHRERAEEVLK